MNAYNELTKKLLAEGYTVDNFPSYVQLPGGVFGKNPLQNIYGGFEYKNWYRCELVYETGCGKHVMGENVIHDMGYMGIEWTHENGNPVIRCPYDKAQCEFNNPLLHGTVGGGLCIQCWCQCHIADKKYNYENSVERRRVYPHLFRKTMATTLRIKDCAIEDIQQILGHKDPSTTLGFYAAANGEHLRQVHNRYLSIGA